jgi:hypothetical protein
MKMGESKVSKCAQTLTNENAPKVCPGCSMMIIRGSSAGAIAVATAACALAGVVTNTRCRPATAAAMSGVTRVSLTSRFSASGGTSGRTFPAAARAASFALPVTESLM